jgi:hypothetical protein
MKAAARQTVDCRARCLWPRTWTATLALLLLFGSASCGYHLAGTNTALPPDIKTVHVGAIENESIYPGLEKQLAFALEKAITQWDTLQLVESPSDADAVLEGKIRALYLRAVSFDQSDLALQYEVSIVADLHLRRISDGKDLWKIRGLRQTEEYSAVAQVVVTSSAQFQQGTLDPVDLTKFTEVQLAESEGRMAMDRLLRDMAHDAYALMTEGF